jgi:hypothetical protein
MKPKSLKTAIFSLAILLPIVSIMYLGFNLLIQFVCKSLQFGLTRPLDALLITVAIMVMGIVLYKLKN